MHTIHAHAHKHTNAHNTRTCTQYAHMHTIHAHVHNTRTCTQYTHMHTIYAHAHNTRTCTQYTHMYTNAHITDHTPQPYIASDPAPRRDSYCKRHTTRVCTTRAHIHTRNTHIHTRTFTGRASQPHIASGLAPRRDHCCRVKPPSGSLKQAPMQPQVWEGSFWAASKQLPLLLLVAMVLVQVPLLMQPLHTHIT